MANRQTYVVGALGVLAGMVVGASSAQNALMVGFSGADPNREGQTVDRTSNILRTRSTMPAAYYVTPRTVPFTEGYIGRIRDNRLADYNMHGSAPVRTVRGAPVILLEDVYDCEGLSGRRFLNCLDNASYESNDWY